MKRITVHHLDEVRRKVADLRTIERVLREMAAQCDGGIVPKCAVIDALFGHASRPRARRAPGLKPCRVEGPGGSRCGSSRKP